MLDTVEAVIEALGGNKETASITSVGPPAVSNWQARGYIPPDKFFVISAALRERGKEVAPEVFKARARETEAAA